jgi:hypothetical protein
MFGVIQLLREFRNSNYVRSLQRWTLRLFIDQSVIHSWKGRTCRREGRECNFWNDILIPYFRSCPFLTILVTTLPFVTYDARTGLTDGLIGMFYRYLDLAPSAAHTLSITYAESVKNRTPFPPTIVTAAVDADNKIGQGDFALHQVFLRENEYTNVKHDFLRMNMHSTMKFYGGAITMARPSESRPCHRINELMIHYLHFYTTYPAERVIIYEWADWIRGRVKLSPSFPYHADEFFMNEFVIHDADVDRLKTVTARKGWPAEHNFPAGGWDKYVEEKITVTKMVADLLELIDNCSL